MVEYSMSRIKHLMFILNVILVICGIAIISVGAVALMNEYTQFFSSKYASAPTILIVVGVFIFAIVFLGYYGANKENYCMVMSYGLLMFIIFIITIAGAITGLVCRKELSSYSEKQNLYQAMLEVFIHNTPISFLIYDDMQSKLQCCGIYGPNDYLGNGVPMRDSCFKNPNDVFRTPYQEGCLPRIVKIMQKNVALAGGFGIITAIIELLGCILAWFLAAAIKRENPESTAFTK